MRTPTAAENRKIAASLRKSSIRYFEKRAAAALRAKTKELRIRRKKLLADARRICKTRSLKIREQVKAYRAQERERINAEVAVMRAKARTTCQVRRGRIKGTVKKVLVQKRELAKAEKQRDKAIAAADKWKEKQTTVETDADVIRNLGEDAAAVALFKSVAKTIKATPRSSRSEVFAEYLGAEGAEEMVERQSETEEALQKRFEKVEASAAKKLAKATAGKVPAWTKAERAHVSEVWRVDPDSASELQIEGSKPSDVSPDFCDAFDEVFSKKQGKCVPSDAYIPF